MAAGEPLSVTQDDVTLHGHSIECRINAEDPDRDFAPTAGRIDTYVAPGGPWTRVDSHCYPGWTISPVLRLADRQADRLGARTARARSTACSARSGEFEIAGRGIKTTIPFHQRVLADAQFRSGDVSTDFVEHFMSEEAAAAAAS